jgi:hypothetical protein
MLAYTKRGDVTMTSKVWTQKQWLRLTGVLSIVVALITVAADELLQYSPQGYSSYLYYRDIVSWRVFLGVLSGVFAIPLSAIGYWHVCKALKLSGIKRTSLMFWVITYGLAIGAAAHGGFAAFIVLIQEGTNASLTRAMDYLQTYIAIPLGLFFLCYLIINAWFFIVVLSRHTLYPKWMAFLNPFLLSILIALLNMSNLFPVLVNVLSPAWLSIPHLVFFTLSTLILWNPKEDLLEKTVQMDINPQPTPQTSHPRTP